MVGTALMPVSLSPDAIIATFSTWAAGGGHRADGPAVTHRPSRRGARRALSRRPAEGARVDPAGAQARFLDAFDAAKILGAHCWMWQPEAMLEHPEMTQMGLAEAAERIGRELDQVTWRDRLTKDGRARRRELTARLAELRECADVIVRLHADGFVADPWLT